MTWLPALLPQSARPQTAAVRMVQPRGAVLSHGGCHALLFSALTGAVHLLGVGHACGPCLRLLQGYGTTQEGPLPFGSRLHTSGRGRDGTTRQASPYNQPLHTHWQRTTRPCTVGSRIGVAVALMLWQYQGGYVVMRGVPAARLADLSTAEAPEAAIAALHRRGVHPRPRAFGARQQREPPQLCCMVGPCESLARGAPARCS
jgi:hypothetical protein